MPQEDYSEIVRQFLDEAASHCENCEHNLSEDRRTPGQCHTACPVKILLNIADDMIRDGVPVPST